MYGKTFCSGWNGYYLAGQFTPAFGGNRVVLALPAGRFVGEDRIFVAFNKSELPECRPTAGGRPVSAKTGAGMLWLWRDVLRATFNEPELEILPAGATVKTAARKPAV